MLLFKVFEANACCVSLLCDWVSASSVWKGSISLFSRRGTLSKGRQYNSPQYPDVFRPHGRSCHMHTEKLPLAVAIDKMVSELAGNSLSAIKMRQRFLPCASARTLCLHAGGARLEDADYETRAQIYRYSSRR